MRILAICGSIRKQSSNLSLLLATQALGSGAAIEVEIYEGLAGLPHFNPDLDKDKPPAGVGELREKIACADALLISTPEYAHGIPGVLKNALDWLVSEPRFGGKPVGLLYGSASDAGFAHQALVEVLKTMSARVVTNAIVSVPGARTKVAADGTLFDAQTREALGELLEALARVGKTQPGSTGQLADS